MVCLSEFSSKVQEERMGVWGLGAFLLSFVIPLIVAFQPEKTSGIEIDTATRLASEGIASGSSHNDIHMFFCCSLFVYA